MGSSVLQSPFSRIATDVVSGLVSTTTQKFSGQKIFLTSVYVGDPAAGGTSISPTNVALYGYGILQLAFGGIGVYASTTPITMGSGWGLPVGVPAYTLSTSTVWTDPTATAFLLTHGAPGTELLRIRALSGNMEVFGALYNKASTLTLQSDLGLTSGQRAVRIGSTVADASFHSTGKLLVISTGIGGAEVEHAWFTGTGALKLNGDPVGTSVVGVFSGIPGNSSGLEFTYGGFALGTGLGNQGFLMVPSYGSIAHNVVMQVASLQGPVQFWGGTNSYGVSTAGDIMVRLGARVPSASLDPMVHLISIGAADGLHWPYEEKAFFVRDGTLEFSTAGVGVVMKSPDGNRWRLTITNAGAALVAAA